MVTPMLAAPGIALALEVDRARLDTWLPDNSTLRDTRLTVDGDGIVGSDSVSTSRHSWRAFSDVT
jgi:hypothetical protein